MHEPVVAPAAGLGGGAGAVRRVAAHAVLVRPRGDGAKLLGLRRVAAAAVVALRGPCVGAVAARAASAVRTDLRGEARRGDRIPRRVRRPSPRRSWLARRSAILGRGLMAARAVGDQRVAASVGRVAPAAVAVPLGARGDLPRVSFRVTAYAVRRPRPRGGVRLAVRVVAPATLCGAVHPRRVHRGAARWIRARQRARRERVARHAGGLAPRLSPHRSLRVALPASLPRRLTLVQRRSVTAPAGSLAERGEMTAVIGVRGEGAPTRLVAAVTADARRLPRAPVRRRSAKVDRGEHEPQAASLGGGVALLTPDPAVPGSVRQRGAVAARAEPVAATSGDGTSPERQRDHH